MDNNALESQNNATQLIASFEGAQDITTRTAVNKKSEVVWVKNDAFGVAYTSSTKTSPTWAKFTTDSEKKETSAAFTGSFDGTEVNATYAVYPYQEGMTLSGSTLTMTLPSEIQASELSNGPMVASASDLSAAVSFKHLAAMLRLTINVIPSGTTKLVVTADKAIAGTATADLSAQDATLSVTNGSTSVTITDLQSKPQTLYIPIPVGTYSSLKVELKKADGTATSTKRWSSVTFSRAGMLYAEDTPEVGYYYYSDGCWSKDLDASKSCIGIVYYISETGVEDNNLKAKIGQAEKYGLVVALKDLADPTVWMTPFYNTGVEKGLNNMNGYSNTRAMREWNKIYPSKDFQIMDGIKKFEKSTPAPSSSSGWFLPSLKELSILCSGISSGTLSAGTNYGVTMRDKMHSSLNNVSGSSNFVSSGVTRVYWSSTGVGQGTHASVLFDNGNIRTDIPSNDVKNKRSARLILAFPIGICKTETADTPTYAWRLNRAKSDDFESSALDANKWTTDVWVSSDIYDFPGTTSNVWLGNGYLRLHVKNQTGAASGKAFSAGRVKSTFKIGPNTAVEVRAKTPPYKAEVSTAIWLSDAPTGANNPNVEIDMMETFPKPYVDVNTPWWPDWKFSSGVIYWWLQGGSIPSSVTIPNGQNWAKRQLYQWDYKQETGFSQSSEFHVYRLERLADRIIFYLDGVEYTEVKAENATLPEGATLDAMFTMERPLVLSVESHTTPNATELGTNGAIFNIDYVHVYDLVAE